MSGETVLLGGSVAQRPGSGGHTWVFLQYLLGLRRLGLDPVLIDWLEPEMCRDRAGAPSAVEASWNVAYLADVMDRFGLGDRWAILHDGGRAVLGMGDAALDRAVDRAALLLNVNGFVHHERVLARVPLRAYVDIDPGFGQMWRALGLHDPFAGHDAFVTIGERIGQPGCTIPTSGLDWITTPQPVALEQWPAQPAEGPGTDGSFTSVASWRGPFAPIEYEGVTYGLRVHEFRRFADLPARTSQRLEVALDIHETETADLELLRAHGWHLADPAVQAADPWAYRSYVQRSKGELMIAKNMYVASRSGWLSDRSICYLASGRPVVAQETGISELYPVGEGLLTFDDPEA
ncbi:MAG: hypothetical protein ACRDLQ_01620, partial [Solirubrobacterales bacterium]